MKVLFRLILCRNTVHHDRVMIVCEVSGSSQEKEGEGRREERRGMVATSSVYFSFYIWSRIQVHGMMSSTFVMNLASSVKLSWKTQPETCLLDDSKSS